MTSTPTIDPAARAAELIGVLGEAAAELAELSAGGFWSGVATGTTPDLVTAVLAQRDLLDVVAVDGVRAVHVTGVLPDGHVSTKRWLEVGAHVAGPTAAALIGRGRDLETDYPATRFAWLAGEITGDAVRELTVGITRALRRVPTEDRDRIRGEAEALLLPLARTVTVAQLGKAIARLRMALDPDGAGKGQLDAHDDQFLRLTPVGDGVDLKGYLTAETAAALLTCLDQVVDGWYRTGSLGPEDQPTGDDRIDRLRRKHRRDHLNALALADLCRRMLDGGSLGTKHAQRPHVTLTVHVEDLTYGVGGSLRLPGLGEQLLPPASVARIPCDADLSAVLTRPTCTRAADAHGVAGHGDGRRGDSAGESVGESGRHVDLDRLAGITREQGREVLHVGRAYRTAPPRLRKALEIRDRHCAAPGCRIDPSRCEAHHVHEWEHGGGTDLDNMVLLCTRHHHAVHEGGMRITRRPEHPPGHPDHWDLAPPPRRPDRARALTRPRGPARAHHPSPAYAPPPRAPAYARAFRSDDALRHVPTRARITPRRANTPPRSRHAVRVTRRTTVRGVNEPRRVNLAGAAPGRVRGQGWRTSTTRRVGERSVVTRTAPEPSTPRP